jgi:hypothetical protein
VAHRTWLSIPVASVVACKVQLVEEWQADEALADSKQREGVAVKDRVSHSVPDHVALQTGGGA